MKKRTLANLTLAALLGLSLAATANDPNKSDKPAMKEVGPKAEQMKLVHKMHHANLMEIEMGGLAQRNGSDAVKRYGQMLVEDHKKADVDLLNVASKVGISMAEPGKPAGRADTMRDKKEKMEQPDAKTPARDMNEKARTDGLRGSGGDAMADKGREMKDDGEMRSHKMMMKDLQALKGPEFDRQFLTMMIRDHQKDIDEVKRGRAAMRGDDELAKLIDQQLPVLQKHLEAAQATLKKIQN
jgi:putative membrane protein